MTLTVIGLLSLATAFGVHHVIHHAISKPIDACARIAEAVSDGDFRKLSAGIRDQIEGWSGEEVDRLIEAFERMASDLGAMSEAAESIAEGQLDGTSHDRSAVWPNAPRRRSRGFRPPPTPCPAKRQPGPSYRPM